MPAFAAEVDAALEEGVEIQFLAAPLEVQTNGGKVAGLKCIRMELGPPDDSGRRRPIPVSGSEFVVNADAIIPAIGQTIDPDLWDTIPGLGRSRRNRIEVDESTCATALDGVFCGGDAVTGPSTVVAAVAAGKQAAISISRYLRGEDMAAGRGFKVPENPEYPPIPAGRPEARANAPELPVENRKNFLEVELALAEDEAQREAGRCLNCGICSDRLSA